MKTRTIVCTIAIASLGFSSLSYAQPSRHEARQDAREARQDIREAQRDLRQADNRREARDAQRDLRDAQRDLRDRPGCQISAHLLIPGWTTTGDAQPHPSAWMPDQVIAFMDDAIARDEFFILCPDGETPRETDEKRIYWNAMDIIANRPALSRWHKDHKQAFAEFMQRPLKL